MGKPVTDGHIAGRVNIHSIVHITLSFSMVGLQALSIRGVNKRVRNIRTDKEILVRQSIYFKAFLSA